MPVNYVVLAIPVFILLILLELVITRIRFGASTLRTGRKKYYAAVALARHQIPN